MSKTKDKYLDEILKRSTAEKLFLVETLWENIRNESITENLEKEELIFVTERYESYKKNTTKVKKWEDIKKNYLKKK